MQIAEPGPSVTLKWTRPERRLVSFVIAGTGPTGERLDTKTTSRGTKTTVTFTGLEPAKNYCFIVGAVYTVTNVAVGPGDLHPSLTSRQ